MQSHHLPPEAWRSEAFAEDLFDASPDAQAALGTQRSARIGRLLLSAVPLVLVLAGAFAWGLGGA